MKTRFKSLSNQTRQTLQQNLAECTDKNTVQHVQFDDKTEETIYHHTNMLVNKNVRSHRSRQRPHH